VKILSEREIERLVSSRHILDDIPEEPSLFVQDFELASANIKVQEKPKFFLTNGVAVKPKQMQLIVSSKHLAPEFHKLVYSLGVSMLPFSFARGKVKAKENLVSPVYFSSDFIKDQINTSEFYDIETILTTRLNLNEQKEYLIVDKKLIETRKGILKEVIKKITKAIFTGKPLSSVSLPIKIMDTKSQLYTFSRITANLSQLHMASRTANHLEAFKHVIAYGCSNLYYGINCVKPITAIDGETNQGFFTDGSLFYAEKISHVPLVCAYQIINDHMNFRVSFRHEAHYVMGSNEMKNYFKGIFTVEINGNPIYFTMATMWMRGMMYGKNTCGFDEYMFFHFPAANLKAFVKINSKIRADSIEGCILPSNENPVFISAKFGSNLFQNLKPRLSDFKNNLCLIEGAFNEKILFDKIVYWESRQKAYKLQISEDVLPSDFRFREDVIWYNYGSLDQAEEWKTKLEEVQREGQKSRQNYSKFLQLKNKK
jgi:hypothetical protein